jgi:FkbM family methyltransferase
MNDRLRRLRRYGRDALFHTLWKAGYELRRLDADGWSTANLRKDGFDPQTIIDVGVGTGTPGLHEAFPSAHHVFIEPLDCFEPDLKRLIRRFGGEYHLIAAGASDGQKTINVDSHVPMQSSLVNRLEDRQRSLVPQQITVTTLTRLANERGWSAPFGVKIDVEGYECDVVAGATGILDRTQFVIAEVSVSDQFGRSCSFARFVALMDEHGFRLCDVLTSPKNRNREIIQIDALFRR